MANKIIKVKFIWGGTGYIPAENIKRKISMTIKTFFGRRENIIINVPIYYTIAQVINEYIKESSIRGSNLISPKIFYPMGNMQELNQ